MNCAKCKYWECSKANIIGKCTCLNSPEYDVPTSALHECDVQTESKWLEKNWRCFRSGDIICDSEQPQLYLVVKVDEDETIWVTSLVLAAFTAGQTKHPVPVFPMTKEELEKGLHPMAEMRLGNLDDYKELVEERKKDIIIYES